MSPSNAEIADKRGQDEFRLLQADIQVQSVVCGEIMTMPGLRRMPAANAAFENADGQIEGGSEPALRVRTGDRRP